MEIRLYNINERNNKINKTLSNNTTLQGQYFDNQNLNRLQPKFLVRINNNFANDFLDKNYCYVRNLNRYYFIENIESYNTNAFILHCRIDILKTCQTLLLSRNFYVEIDESNESTKMQNNTNFVKNLNPIIEKYNFSRETPFTENGSIIMITEKGNI